MKSLLAAISLFTRIPIWRLNIGRGLETAHYANALKWWPLIGIISGGLMSLIIWGGEYIMPSSIAVIIAIIARIILTGAMHEDGLADLCDGFGGGKDKETILSIMKDSHIGTYGTIGLILYFVLLYAQISTILERGIALTAPLIIAAECISRASALWIPGTLPYARKVENCKVGFLYNTPSKAVMIVMAFISIIPIVFIGDYNFVKAIVLTTITLILLHQTMKSKLGGYTGDCCGASVLILEQATYLGFQIVIALWK